MSKYRDTVNAVLHTIPFDGPLSKCVHAIDVLRKQGQLDWDMLDEVTQRLVTVAPLRQGMYRVRDIIELLKVWNSAASKKQISRKPIPLYRNSAKQFLQQTIDELSGCITEDLSAERIQSLTKSLVQLTLVPHDPLMSTLARAANLHVDHTSTGPSTSTPAIFIAFHGLPFLHHVDIGKVTQACVLHLVRTGDSCGSIGNVQDIVRYAAPYVPARTKAQHIFHRVLVSKILHQFAHETTSGHWLSGCTRYFQYLTLCAPSPLKEVIYSNGCNIHSGKAVSHGAHQHDISFWNRLFDHDFGMKVKNRKVRTPWDDGDVTISQLEKDVRRVVESLHWNQVIPHSFKIQSQARVMMFSLDYVLFPQNCDVAGGDGKVE